MKILPLETVSISDSATSRFQDNVKNLTLQLTDAPFLKGRMLTVLDSNGQETKNIPLTTTLTAFSHKLGVAPLGYFVTYKSASANIYGSLMPTLSDTDKDFIKLQASSSVTVNIWVF